MSKFTNSYMTNAGKKLMFGGGQVTYTRAALFTQDVSAMSVDAIRKLDALDGQILSANVGIASQRPQDNGNSTIKVEATFSNAGQKQDAKFASVGWFAKTASTSETLIAVCEVEGGILGAGDPSGASTASINASVNITIGDSTTVTALVDPSGTVTKTVLDSELAKKDDTTDVDAKIANLKGTVDTKADKATVDAEIGKIDFTPYAKTADVNSALAKKDDTTDVDAKLSRKADSTTVTNLTNTTRETTNSLQSLITQINGTRLPLYQGSANEDLKGYMSPQIRMYSGVGGVKNIPSDSKYQSACFGTLLVLPDGSNNTTDGSLIWISPERKAWFAQTNGGGASTWSAWSRFALDSDISNLQNSINGLNNKVNVNAPLYRDISSSATWKDIFGKDNGTVGGPPICNYLVSIRDDSAGQNTVGSNSSAIGFGGNDTKGLLSVAYGSPRAIIAGGNGKVPTWKAEIAWKSDIQALQNQITDLTNQLAYIKANYVQGKRFAAGQEAAAEQWENSNPNGIAFVEK